MVYSGAYPTGTFVQLSSVSTKGSWSFFPTLTRGLSELPVTFIGIPIMPRRRQTKSHFEIQFTIKRTLTLHSNTEYGSLKFHPFQVDDVIFYRCFEINPGKVRIGNFPHPRF